MGFKLFILYEYNIPSHIGTLTSALSIITTLFGQKAYSGNSCDAFSISLMSNNTIASRIHFRILMSFFSRCSSMDWLPKLLSIVIELVIGYSCISGAECACKPIGASSGDSSYNSLDKFLCFNSSSMLCFFLFLSMNYFALFFSANMATGK